MKLKSIAVATAAAVASVFGFARPALTTNYGYYAYIHYTGCYIDTVYVDGIGYTNATGPLYDTSPVVSTLQVAYLELDYLISDHAGESCDQYTVGVKYNATHGLVPNTYAVYYQNPWAR